MKLVQRLKSDGTYQTRVARWQKLFAKLDDNGRWEVRQAIASPGRFYGDGGTIHDSDVINVEVDQKTGEVVSLWFRCQLLPFDVTKVSPARAQDMRTASVSAQACRLAGVEIVDLVGWGK